MDQLLFTPSSILSLLTQIDELKDKQIELTESLDGSLHLSIGNSKYVIQEEHPVEFEVDNDVVEEVDELNEDTYLDLQESGDVEMDFVTELDEDSVAVKGGILSELFKTLAVGGMVRLTSKMLTPKQQKEFDDYTSQHMTYYEQQKAKRDNIYQFRRRG